MIAPASQRGQQTGGTHPSSGLCWLPLALSAFATQLALIYALGSSDNGRDWLPILLPPAHALLLPFLVRNLSFWGIRLVLVGLTLNLIAMGANGGLMPVAPAAVEAIGRHDLQELRQGESIPGSKNVLLESDETHVRWLSDAIVLPVPRPYKRAVSVGDLLVVGGVAVTFFEVVRRYRLTSLPDEDQRYGTDSE